MSDSLTAAGDEPLYAIPSGAPTILDLAPRKTSWDAGTASSQTALAAYLDHVQELAASRLNTLTGDLVLRLDVGLPAGVDPLHEHDLDNFLHPVIDRLGGRRFVSAWATKAPGEHSSLRIEPARPALAEAGWQRFAGRTTVSSAREREWKAQVKQALADASELPGPVGVQISLIIDPSRSWPNLWKMAIDALDPLLGRSFPDDEWDPNDGRVVRLGIHVREDTSVGWDVPFVIRARPASLDWPEMAWFAAMTECERAAWLAEHARRCAPNRRSRRGTRPRADAAPPQPTEAVSAATAAEAVTKSATAAVQPAGVNRADIREITSVEAFNAAIDASDLIVITDSARPAKLHPAARRCAFVTEASFTGKVIERGGRTGRYYTAPSQATARARWARMTTCGNCG